MFGSRLLAVLLLAPWVTPCVADLPRRPDNGMKAVLIAGDGSLPVFDNAVAAMQGMLRGNADIRRLTGATALVAQGVAAPATPDNILATLAAMRPARGQSCFVFVTSHGAEGFGLVLGMTDEALDPKALDAALVQGCGDAPTVLVMSGCYSGIYVAPPMTRPNRIILSAARSDRSSFGCQAGRVYTVYDKCLLDAVHAEADWKHVYAATKACVVMEEHRERVTPSGPLAWFGSAVADMAVPGTRTPPH